MPLDPTERFSSRTDNYVRYRPGSPAEVLELMKSECGLRPHDVIADIASGTGIFTRMLLENGNRVFAVEPNAAMRQAADKSLTQYKNLASVNGRAEATTLFHHTMDFVTAAQAAHWFDREKARQEFARILKPEGIHGARILRPFCVNMKTCSQLMAAIINAFAMSTRRTIFTNSSRRPAFNLVILQCSRNSIIRDWKAACFLLPTHRKQVIPNTNQCCMIFAAFSILTSKMAV